MGIFTFIPVWVLQDVLVYLAAVVLMVHIVRHEKHPASILLEFVCFVLLYAAVFENFATLMGWYGYGRSVLMVFNVPLSVPVMEYMVVYVALKTADAMRIPTWSRPFFVGAVGALTDLSLDPLAISQRYATAEGTIGRWTWYPAATDLQLHAVPVYNYTGWILLCGYAAAFLLLGRAWHRKSARPVRVGLTYPPLAMLLSLLVLVSPLSNFLLWLGPFFQKGSAAEAVMLGLFFLVFFVVLVGFWRGRMKRELSLREDWPLLFVPVGFHAMNLMFAIGGGYWDILPLTLPFAALHVGLVLWIFLRGKRRPAAAGS